MALNAPSGRLLAVSLPSSSPLLDVTPAALLCLSTSTENPKWSRNNRSLISIHRLPLYKGAFTRAIHDPVPTHVKDLSLSPRSLGAPFSDGLPNGRVTFDVEKNHSVEKRFHWLFKAEPSSAFFIFLSQFLFQTSSIWDSSQFYLYWDFKSIRFRVSERLNPPLSSSFVLSALLVDDRWSFFFFYQRVIPEMIKPSRRPSLVPAPRPFSTLGLLLVARSITTNHPSQLSRTRLTARYHSLHCRVLIVS